MCKVSTALSTFGISAGCETTAARTIGQCACDLFEQFLGCVLPDEVLIATAVNDIGTTVAVKVRGALTHAA